jgi:hypothetical protein
VVHSLSCLLHIVPSPSFKQSHESGIIETVPLGKNQEQTWPDWCYIFDKCHPTLCRLSPQHRREPGPFI